MSTDQPAEYLAPITDFEQHKASKIEEAQRKIDSYKWYVTHKEAANRYAICETCPSYDNQTQRCALCNCWMPAIVVRTYARCPDKKWWVGSKNLEKIPPLA